jgi:hypothetical protein
VLLSVLLSAVLQLLVFAAVPFITYLVSRRRARGFFEYVGLVAPTARALAAIVVAMTGLVGWLLGYVNERVGNGSILPSWGAHGATNLIAYGVLAFTTG